MRRLIIRKFKKSDITKTYISWLNDKSIMKFSENRHFRFTKKKCLLFYEKNKKNKNFFFIIKKNNKLKIPIGTIIGNVDHKNKVCDLGILISETGKGYGLEAWKFTLNYIFTKKIRKITAGCMRTNYAMLKIFQRSNMSYEYRKKEHFLNDNKKVDLIGYCIFKKKYN